MANTDVLLDDAVTKIQSTVAKSVATKLVPFLTLALVPAVAWAQEKIGVSLDPTQLAVFIGSAVLGIAGVAISYIRGRLQGTYALHAVLLDKGVDALAQGKEDLEAAGNVPLPKNV